MCCLLDFLCRLPRRGCGKSCHFPVLITILMQIIMITKSLHWFTFYMPWTVAVPSAIVWYGDTEQSADTHCHYMSSQVRP